MSEADWPGYLAGFHQQRAGITEGVLGHATLPAVGTAYDWLAAAVPADRDVLDLACGNGAQARRLPPGRNYVGIDLSTAELAAARTTGQPHLVRADTARLPLADGSVDVVLCSMALMLIPLADSLAEIRRVLRSGGLLVASVPAAGPLTLRDRLRYGGLCLALRHWRLRYPNDRLLRTARAALAEHGLHLLADESRRFVCAIENAAVGAMLVDSLYLPDATVPRLHAAHELAGRWTGARLGLPIRRIVARATA